MNAAQIKTMWDKDPNAVAHALSATLRDFGYSAADDTYVKAEITRLYAGEAARGGPSMFIKRWLDKGIDDEGTDA